jgi:fucose 4-O-acetylase-like acetyltransferase
MASRRDDRRPHLALAMIGATIIALGAYAAARPSPYPHVSFWTSSPAWFAIRVGVLMVAVMMLYALDCIASTAPLRRLVAPLETLGASSLFVYWIHVELVYGYASWMIHGRLPLWGTLVAYGLFSAFIYGAVLARDRLLDGWRARSGGRRILVGERAR